MTQTEALQLALEALERLTESNQVTSEDLTLITAIKEILNTEETV
jgi:hypothetical protein